MSNDGDNAKKLKEALTPYIKTRQEALHVRKIQAAYLTSLSGISEAGASHLQLTNPGCALLDGFQVKHVPREVTGLRRTYFEKLQANLAAKEEYERQSQHAAALEGAKKSSKTHPSIETRLALLRERRRHERLQILDHYLSKLSKTEACQPDYLNLHHAMDQAPQPPMDMMGSSSGMHGALGDDRSPDGLVDRLEKAVLAAKAQLAREERLIAEVKSIRSDQKTTQKPTASRVAALSRTRDELVSWVEEQLATSNNPENGHLDTSASQKGGDHEDLDGHITVQYQAYLRARTNLLCAVSAVSSPLPKAPSLRLGERDEQEADNAGGRHLHVLPFIDQQLLPQSELRESAIMQQSHLSTRLRRQKLSTSHVLDRLGDESHLLHTYPYLAKQKRFQKAVAALDRKSNLEDAAGEAKPSEILGHAEAWGFASQAAQTATSESVDRHLDQAAAGVDGARQGLDELGQILGQHETGQDSNDESEEDIWAVEGRNQHLRARKTGPTSSTGPWMGLIGKVGVISDG